jgi:hypothetical protein
MTSSLANLLWVLTEKLLIISMFYLVTLKKWCISRLCIVKFDKTSNLLANRISKRLRLRNTIIKWALKHHFWRVFYWLNSKRIDKQRVWYGWLRVVLLAANAENLCWQSLVLLTLFDWRHIWILCRLWKITELITRSCLTKLYILSERHGPCRRPKLWLNRQSLTK